MTDRRSGPIASWKWAKRVALLATITLSYAVGCATRGDEGSESNFVRCVGDEDCDSLGTRYACVAGRCKVASRKPLSTNDASIEAGSCRPANCLPTPLGAPCCVGPNGPCGVDVGLGCRAYGGSGGGGGMGAGTGAGPGVGGAGGSFPLADSGPRCEPVRSPATPVVTDVGPCEVALPPPPQGQTLDTQHINVAFRNGGTEVMGAHIRNDDPHGCVGATNGWYYDDPAQPRKAILCWCSPTAPGLEVTLLFGCPTIPASTPVECGSTTCYGSPVGTIDLAPCCSKSTNCGLEVIMPSGLSCYELRAPTVDAPECPDGYVSVLGNWVKGCCLRNGQCGLHFTSEGSFDPPVVDFGCVPPADVGVAYEGGGPKSCGRDN